MILVKHARYFSPFENILGYYEEPDENKNKQIPNTYSQYALNIAMETLLLKCQPLYGKS